MAETNGITVTNVGATDILNGAAFTSNLDGRMYRLVKGEETAAVWDRDTGSYRMAKPGEQGALRYQGNEYLVDASTGEIVRNFRTDFNYSNYGSDAADFIHKSLGVDMEREADGSYTELAKERRNITWNFSSEDIGSHQRATIEEQPQIISRINPTGSYVIADVMRGNTVLRQNVYDPNGKLVGSANPLASERDARFVITDPMEALIEAQTMAFGTKDQRVRVLENRLARNITRLSTYDLERVGSVNQSRLNASIRSDAQFLIAAKTGSTYDFLTRVNDTVTSMSQGPNVALDIRDWRAIATSSNPIAAIASANAAALQFIQPSGDSAWGDSPYTKYNAPGGVTTSNGFTIGYRFDKSSLEEGVGGVKGRLAIISPTGVAISHLGDDRFDFALANLQTGFGSFDAGEFAEFVSDKQFRAGDLNQQYINRLTNEVTAFEPSNPYYTVDASQGPIVNPGWLGGGNLQASWTAQIEDYQRKLDEEVAAERAAQAAEEGRGATAVVAPTTVAPSVETPVGGVSYQDQQTPVTPPTTAPPTTGIETPTGITTPEGITPPSITPPTTYPQTGTTGTFQVPSMTSGVSAVPTTVNIAPGVAGYNPAQLTQTTPGVQDPSQVGVRTVTYTNQMGQSIPVTESNGQPITYVPPGYTRASGAALGGLMVKGYQGGGSVDDSELDAMYRMATRFLGYRGPKSREALENFAKSSPAAATKMRAYTSAMAKGGMVKGYQEGGSVAQLNQSATGLISQTMQPMQAPISYIQPTEMDFIPASAGQVAGVAPLAETATVPTITQAGMPNLATPASFQPQTVAPQIQTAMQQFQPAQTQLAPQAQVQAAQQQETSVAQVEAAQGTAILMNNPVQREIQQGELISGTAVDATKVAELNNQIQAAQATPTAQATIQGQLEGLMAQFEGGATPVWAAGAMRNAMAQLSARGLGASSLAGQAVVQAAMESAMPIAQIDAQTRAQFEAQNLSNRQQAAMMAAQQRASFLQLEFDQEFQSRVQNASKVADIANMNFTAEQQIALENSRIANTANLQNLSNRQAMVMAEAAALANMDMANLNNRQQAAVQNAQNFLQVDLTNLNNEQQAALFKAQQNAQALFTDQSAENAALQFNASSENQTNQFFASLSSQVSQFNATQQNAMEQFNINSVNAMRQFNSEVQQQRDLFNAQNGLIIAQANAQWRQNIATLNNAAQNQSNMDFAKTMNALTAANLDQIWQRERDIMNYAFTQSESSMDRALSILLADKELDAYREKMAADQRDARAAFGTSVLLEWMK